eukprot:403364022
MSYILPQQSDDLIENELLDLSQDNKRFLKRYLEVFLSEIRYFIELYHLQEIIKNRGGLAYILVKNDSGSGTSPSKVFEGKESSQKSQLLMGNKLQKVDRFQSMTNQLSDEKAQKVREAIEKVDAGEQNLSDMDISEHKKQSANPILPIRRKIIKKIKASNMKERGKVFQNKRGNYYEDSGIDKVYAGESHIDYGFSDSESKKKQGGGSGTGAGVGEAKFQFKKKLTSFMPPKKIKPKE